jgi:hypothetical protein
MLVVLLVLTARAGAAEFRQDTRLEAGLRANDPAALALLPSAGSSTGAVDFFRLNNLVVVPSSVSAWCADSGRGPMQPGCYIELHVQIRGERMESVGAPCGRLARWYKAPGASAYSPWSSGAGIARAIAEGNASFAIEQIRGDTRSFCYR